MGRGGGGGGEFRHNFAAAECRAYDPRRAVVICNVILFVARRAAAPAADDVPPRTDVIRPQVPPDSRDVTRSDVTRVGRMTSPRRGGSRARWTIHLDRAITGVMGAGNDRCVARERTSFLPRDACTAQTPSLRFVDSLRNKLYEKSKQCSSSTCHA